MSQTILGTLYRFSLTKPGSKPTLLRVILIMALKAAKLTYGRARLKLETNYQISSQRPVCTIAGGTKCGDDLANIFTELLIEQVGEQGFKVERLIRKDVKP
ncbi:MAG: hypothetical protein HY547_09220 [Elusimicrobia bacterium]|nr:hypothetical protein [Elusimicrobiota bacterium]